MYKKEVSMAENNNSEINSAISVPIITDFDKKEVLAEEILEDIGKNDERSERLSEKDYEDNFKAMLRKTSFGTELREALEKISEGKLGAIIILSDPNKLKGIMLGGFKLNCKFTSERLVELSKMDGAIILDSHLKKIYYANVLLNPNHLIPSRETGTRHQAAERTAKQTGQLAIAVSQRTSNISLYTKYFKYKLRTVGNLITRLQSVLDSLDEQKKIFSSLINYLNILEFTNLVTAVHIISVMQKAEFISRGNKIAKRYLTELGTESQLLELRLKEIIKNVDEDYNNVLKDYGKRSSMILRKEISKLSYDDLLEFDNLKQTLEFKSIEEGIETRGFRILSKIPALNQKQIKILTKNYPSLRAITEANVEELKNIRGINDFAGSIKDEIDRLKNSAMLSQSL